MQERLEVKADGKLKRKRSKMEEAAKEATEEEEVAGETMGGQKAKSARETAKTKLKARCVFLQYRY